MKASTSRWLALSGAALLAAVLFLLATLPTSDYLFVPNSAHPIAGKVDVQGKGGPEGPGGIYYVDVTVRKVRWLERLIPFLRPDGASLVPPQAVTAPGETFKQRIVEARAEMQRSEEVAAAVALREGGLDVGTTPKGVMIEAVATDVPAAKVISNGDVIVAVDGRKVATVEQLLRVTSALRPGERVRLGLRRDGRIVERTVATVAAPGDEKRAIIGIRVSQDAKIALPLKVDIDLGDVGGPRRGSRSRSRSTGARSRRRPWPPDRSDRRDRARREHRVGRRDQAEDLRRSLVGGRRLPRTRWGKHSHRTPVCRRLAGDPCGEF